MLYRGEEELISLGVVIKHFGGHLMRANRLVLLTAALAAPLLVAAISGASPPRSPHSTLVVTVAPTTSGRPIPSGFVGLSLEYSTVAEYAGTDASAINPVFVVLIRALAPGRRPVLRIGGNSTDRTWWPVSGTSRPPGVKYSLTPRWLASARGLARSTRARLILGINLEANRPPIAVPEAQALLAGIGRRYVDALEIGNEPDLYAWLGWYRAPSGRIVLGRRPGYDFRGYIRDFSGLARLLPKVPLAGPGTGTGWTSHLGKIVASEPALGVLTVHAYQLGCRHDPTLPAYPTVPRLLRPGVWRAHMRLLEPYVAFAHAHHVAFRIGEMNSVSCHGKRGVSDTFASALWALEALFDAERAGIDGVNIHTYDGTANRLFTFRHQQGQWLGSVYPEYYGLLMFAQASPPGSRLLSITAPGSGALESWATLASDGRIRVVLINESLARGRSVLVRAPGAGPRIGWPGRARAPAGAKRLRPRRSLARRPELRPPDDDRRSDRPGTVRRSHARGRRLPRDDASRKRRDAHDRRPKLTETSH